MHSTCLWTLKDGLSCLLVTKPEADAASLRFERAGRTIKEQQFATVADAFQAAAHLHEMVADSSRAPSGRPAVKVTRADRVGVNRCA